MGCSASKKKPLNIPRTENRLDIEIKEFFSLVSCTPLLHTKLTSSNGEAEAELLAHF
jgi:hypothetical protein